MTAEQRETPPDVPGRGQEELQVLDIGKPREGPSGPADDRIDVGDPEAALARLGQARPMRSSDPLRQPPTPQEAKRIEKGAVYWIIAPEDLDQPRRGRVVRLTKTPGKFVGIEFEDPVGPHIIHNCDGAGRNGHCLYCRPDQVLTDDEYRAYYEHFRTSLRARAPLEDLDVLVLDVGPDGRPVLR